MFALRHEQVHAFMTPKNPWLRGARADMYLRRGVWKAFEEGTAETFAYLRTGSGILESFKEGISWGVSQYNR